MEIEMATERGREGQEYFKAVRLRRMMIGRDLLEKPCNRIVTLV